VAARQLQNDLETYRVSVVTGNLRGAAAAHVITPAAAATAAAAADYGAKQQRTNYADLFMYIMLCTALQLQAVLHAWIPQPPLDVVISSRPQHSVTYPCTSSISQTNCHPTASGYEVLLLRCWYVGATTATASFTQVPAPALLRTCSS
jgi:hypothetical protein